MCVSVIEEATETNKTEMLIKALPRSWLAEHPGGVAPAGSGSAAGAVGGRTGTQRNYR